MGKKFTDEQRQRAVRMMAELGCSVKQVAEKIGCTQETARKWKNAHIAELSEDEKRSFEEAENENKRLRRELAQAKLELEILKKAAAYFARESM